MSLEQEDAAAAKVAVAPRVTLQDLKDNIIAEYTSRASVLFEGPEHEALECLTICVLVTKSGFTLVGKSACASPENYNAELGANIARDDAIRQLWPLMGYALRDKLAAQSAE